MDSKSKLRSLNGVTVYLVNDLPKEVSDRNKKIRKAAAYMKNKNIDAKLLKGNVIVNGISLSDEQINQIIAENEGKKRNRSEEEENNAIVKSKQTEKKPKTLMIPANLKNKDSRENQAGTPTTIKKNFTSAKNPTFNESSSSTSNVSDKI